MIHLPKHLKTSRKSPQSAPVNYLIDYLRVQGSAQMRFRSRFANQINASLDILARPEDGIIPVGVASDSGRRPRNEDCGVALVGHFGSNGRMQPALFAAVSDGIGGWADGDLASAITLESMTTLIMDTLSKHADKTNWDGPRGADIEAMLTRGVEFAHRQTLAKTNHGGSVLTCALVIRSIAFLAHVGDCRAYLLNPDRKDIDPITRDHRLIQEWHDHGLLTDRQMIHHPLSGVLSRHIGGRNSQAEIVCQPLAPGARLLLCSDGVWEALNQAEIAAITRRSDHPQEACEQLISSAVGHGARDDVTAAIVEVSP